MDSELILRMEEQHERISELCQRAAENAAAVVDTADEQGRGELADTLTELIDALGAHLHDEAVHILPLVERVMTVEQWQALGVRGRAGIPQDRQLVFLGFLLAANDTLRCRLPGPSLPQIRKLRPNRLHRSDGPVA